MSAPAAPDQTTATTNATATTTATTPATTTAPPTATAPTTTTTTAGSCTRYDIVAPEKPPEFDESSARAFTKTFERRYQVARLRATYEGVEVSTTHWRTVTTNTTAEGVEVTVNLQLYWSSEEVTAKGGYPTTYRFVDGQVSRDGAPIRCWG